ncbi:MAG: hypothetical protein O9262_07500, partial [Cyclobacteriaceae bacterium]|nr:hypothetical protein [Cyclobacteriaceae bacterium]
MHLPSIEVYAALALLVVATACSTTSEKKTDDIPAPVAEKQPYEITSNGNKRIDNYFWMRLSEEQKNAAEKDEQTQKVLTYLNAENDYLKAKT